MPKGFYRLIGAQFLSSLGDNALLIVVVAWLQATGRPGWWAPMLKFCATASYVALAPLVGAWSDSIRKARLMAYMNALKMAAVLGLIAGLNPLGCFVILGAASAAYAPAKYGLVTELVDAQRLVRANGWIEVSVVCAVLLGTGLGGLLVSAPALGLLTPSPVLPAEGLIPALRAAMLALLAIYLGASWLNVGLPDSGARYRQQEFRIRPMVVVFAHANRTLWRDREGCLSMSMTTLFWGVGATLQFAVLRWAVDQLGLTLSHGAMLQAAVAVGVVLGAGVAGRWMTVAHAPRLLGLGVALGLVVVAAAQAKTLPVVMGLLALVGALGGLLVVPMNALLQHRGHRLLSAGQSIAVQNFNENASILAMLGAYALCLRAGVPIVPLISALGALMMAATGARMWRRGRL